MEIPAFLYEQAGVDVQVEAMTGEGAFGPVYAPAVTVRAIVEDKRRKIRSASGDLVASSTRLFCPLSTVCPVGSRVTRGGVATTVLASTPRDGGTLPVPSHLEVSVE